MLPLACWGRWWHGQKDSNYGENAIIQVGYESHDRAAPGGTAAPKIAAPEICFSLLEAQRGIIPFFSLYQLQIVLLTIANKKILVFPKL